MKVDDRRDLIACMSDAQRRIHGAYHERGPVAPSTIDGLMKGVHAMDRDRQRALAFLTEETMEPEERIAAAREHLEFS